MQYDDEQLSRIYDRTSGYCHICGRKLAFTNYAWLGRRGAWEVEHSNPRTKSGSDRLSNLYAACILCNREKAATTTRTARAWYGRKKAPLSRSKRNIAKAQNGVVGGLLGGFVGAIAGPVGILAGVVIRTRLGYRVNPDQH